MSYGKLIVVESHALYTLLSDLDYEDVDSTIILSESIGIYAGSNIYCCNDLFICR